MAQVIDTLKPIGVTVITLQPRHRGQEHLAMHRADD